MLYQMFLTVYLSSNEQHFSEVPITPETLCRDVVELCKEPGEVDCYLAELWRGSERIVGEGERMLEVLQQWGQQRGEVRYLLHHQRAPGRELGNECTHARRLFNPWRKSRERGEFYYEKTDISFCVGSRAWLA
uniref:Ras-associating domain-containing protein n=1 Tax=Monopterus albus TaxID=43700 RepID=A0A3Q3J048_MONAL